MKSIYLWLGWVFCEIAFKTDCWGPFASFYQMGCWFYGKALAGVPNPYLDNVLDGPDDAEESDASKKVDDGTRL